MIYRQDCPSVDEMAAQFACHFATQLKLLNFILIEKYSPCLNEAVPTGYLASQYQQRYCGTFLLTMLVSDDGDEIC